MMQVLIGFEQSGVVSRAFRLRGHTVISCDLLPTDGEGPHYQGDIKDAIRRSQELFGITRFDLGVFFPPCTYLSSSGLHWNTRIAGRKEKTEEALELVRYLMEIDIDQIAIENPVGCISTRIRKPDQSIQPYQFGHDASKRTCLWLKGLPQLKPTKLVKPQLSLQGKLVWGNQTPSGQNKLGPSPNRAKLRSRTYQGVGNAMASQWG